MDAHNKRCAPTRRLFDELHPPIEPPEAVVEADACLQCGGPHAPAPCTAACPTSIDVPGFIREIAEGRPLEAARIILRDNILGGTCARVCPVEELCQGACVLHKRGRRAIQIGRLQRFATDALEAAEDAGEAISFHPDHPPAARGKSVGIIGAGPAGLACAAELARLGYSVVVYERDAMPGGMVVRGIAPYKQIVDPIPAEVHRIQRMGVEFRFEVDAGRDITPAQLRERHLALFIGAGMGPDTPANLPGEDLPGVWNSLEFIERIKDPDGARASRIDVGQRVVVIGGGNTAVDVAREAVRLGAREVTLVYRRDEAQMPAYRHELDAARREGVRLTCLAAPVEFLNGARRSIETPHVIGVRCIRMQLSEPDASGRPRPVPIPGSEFDIHADVVIKAIGQRPLLDLFKTFGLELTGGKLHVDDDSRTTQSWCYAGGDCTNGGATVVQAVREGRDAARAIHRALAGLPRPPIENPPLPVIAERGTVIAHMQGSFELATSPLMCKGCSICVESCPAETLALDRNSRIEVLDVNRCVFCGICEDRCPDFAIWLHKNASVSSSGHAPEVPA